MRRRLLEFGSVSVLCVVGLLCVGIARAEPPEVIRRTAVLGASASDGFNAYYWRLDDGKRVRDRIDLPTLLRIASDEQLVVTDLATAQFFANPSGIGTRIIDRAITAAPDLVVAIDFLFWFGYGTVGIDAKRIRTTEERLAMLDYGLDLLDRIDAPMIVGDIPDMSNASGRVLLPSQVPEESVRRLMNDRITAWADARERVTVFPLSDLHARLGGSGDLLVGGQVLPAAARKGMLQGDRLHPTLGGLLAIVAELDAVIGEYEPVASRMPPLETDFETLRTRVRGFSEEPSSESVATPSNETE